LINLILALGGEVAYSATDSVYTNIDLTKHPAFKDLVGEGLGQFKLERSFKEGVFARGGGLYALDQCTGKKPQVIKHGGYNRSDISFEDIKELALHGQEIYRETNQWRQGIVTDKLAPDGAFSWFNKRIRMSNQVGKAFPIEYGGLRIGLVPQFFILDQNYPHISFQFWREFTQLKMLPGHYNSLGFNPKGVVPLSNTGAKSHLLKDLHISDLNLPIRDICTEVPNTAGPKRRHS
jgi:hypothetical protein